MEKKTYNPEDLKAANAYVKERHASSTVNELQHAMNLAVVFAFIAGCEYKEKQLKSNNNEHINDNTKEAIT